MHKAMRGGPLVVSAVLLLSVGVLATQAGGSGSSRNLGPMASTHAVAPEATQMSPTPAFQPSPVALTFTQITPCRIVDTRIAGGRLAANTTRNFNVGGTAGFAAQGGNNTGCGIPTTATAVAISIIAVNPAAKGFLTAWPFGQVKPLASVLNFAAGQTANTGLTVSIAPAAPALSVFAGTLGSVDVVIDVSGYYEPQTHFIVLSSGQLWYGTATHVIEEDHTAGTGTYTLIFDRSLTGCNVIATDNGDHTVRAEAGWGGTSLYVTTYVQNGTGWTQSDQGFQVFITC